jgi:hypothetical protein
MKQVIDRALYDTENAEKIARYAPNTDRSDFGYLIETLYETSDGSYFIHGEGEPKTQYAKQTGNGRSGGAEIRVVTEEEAVNWCEERAIDGETILAEFEEHIEVK